jgi:type II secretory ATPase GspE/PulE/Tfp pilus assembly ATPase PilB-like protein
MGAQPFLLSSTINVVVAQRLVRKICVSCIESYSLTEETKKLVKAQMAMTGNEHITERAIPTRLFRGKGCKICNNAGYHGQIGIFEILPTSEVVKDLILKSAPTGDIKKQAISEGMKTMFEDGLDKVEKGITTLEEILRVIRE